MFNKVILTFSTRILTALLSVANVLIGTNYLGVKGFGTISLIILGISIYLMIQNFLTGSSIVFFSSKYQASSIAFMSYLWVVVSVGLFLVIIGITRLISAKFNLAFELIPEQFVIQNVLLAAGYGLMNIHLNILLGKERIKAFNFIFFLQHAILTALLVLFFIVLDRQEINYYLLSMQASYLIAFATALMLSYRFMRNAIIPSRTQFIAMLRYGTLGQFANIFQLLNYRLSYYLIDIFIGRAGLGIFSAATQISEGLWILGKSIATVLFARISNSTDMKYAKYLTLRLLKFTIIVTSIPLLIFTIIPIDAYTYFLGSDFQLVRTVIRWLSVGTISLTASMLLSHYFSGSGEIIRNTYASGIGVIITLILGFSVIPLYGIRAAGMVNSASYLTSLLYLWYHFRKNETYRLKDLLPTLSDIKESWRLITSRFYREIDKVN